MAFLLVAEKKRPAMWRVAANMLNKQSRTADKMWSSNLDVGLCDYLQTVALCDCSQPVALCDYSQTFALCDYSQTVVPCDCSQTVALCDYTHKRFHRD